VSISPRISHKYWPTWGQSLREFAQNEVNLRWQGVIPELSAVFSLKSGLASSNRHFSSSPVDFRESRRMYGTQQRNAPHT
jgi:hypothetical protein